MLSFLSSAGSVTLERSGLSELAEERGVALQRRESGDRLLIDLPLVVLRALKPQERREGALLQVLVGVGGLPEYFGTGGYVEDVVMDLEGKAYRLGVLRKRLHGGVIKIF